MFKVGDEVVICFIYAAKTYDHRLPLGSVHMIIEVDDTPCPYRVVIQGYNHWFYKEEVRKLTKLEKALK